MTGDVITVVTVMTVIYILFMSGVCEWYSPQSPLLSGKHPWLG